MRSQLEMGTSMDGGATWSTAVGRLRDGLREQGSGLRRALAWASLAAVYVLVRINIVDIPLERDEGLFGYIGQIIGDGGLPYRDVIDHKPPLVHYLCALAVQLVPPTATGIHIFLHAFNFLTMLAMYHVARVFTESRETGLWTALAFAMLSSLPSLQGFAASTEMFLLLPASLTMLCALLAGRKHHFRWSVLSGMMGGLTVLTKLTGAWLVLLPAIVLVVRAYRNADSSRSKLAAALARGLAWFLGLFLPLGFVGMYFFLRGAFTDLVHWTIAINLDYAAQWRELCIGPNCPGIVASVLRDGLPLCLAALGTTAILLIRADRRGLFLAGYFAFSIIAALPLPYPHYMAQAVPVGALAAGIGFSRFRRWCPEGPWRRMAFVSICALTVAFPLLSRPRYYVTGSPYTLSQMLYGTSPFPVAKQVADYLAERTDEDDRIFVLGSEAEILFLAQRRSPTRFALKYPLTSGWSKQRLQYQKRVIEVLKAGPPEYILTVDCRESLLWDGVSPFPLSDYVRSLTKADYFLEAAQPMGEGGHPLMRGDAARQALAAGEAGREKSILVFRRIGT